jgi:hypothetical protein
VENMKNLVYTWFGLKTIGGRKSRFSISYLGKCVGGWKDYYGDLKPWQHFGYSNPIFCKSKNWGYDETLGRYRVVFCLLWHKVQW